jgi:hypothetical protein
MPIVNRKSKIPRGRLVQNPRKFPPCYLAGVILLAFTLRVVQLNTLPFSLNLDEATNALDALQLYRLAWLTPFLQNNFGRETLFFYFQGLALRLFGISFFSLRFVSALLGTLAIPLLYIVAYRLLALWSPQPHKKSASYHPVFISLLAAAGLALAYWHIFFSRMALRAILLPPLLLLLIWCFWRGWFNSKKATGWLLVAGFLLGLTFYTYLATRLLPLLVVLFAAIDLIINRPNRKNKALKLFIVILVAVLTALPLGFYFWQNPQALNSRAQAISILAANEPLNALGSNMISLLWLHLPGLWLGQWPGLNPISALGFWVGLAVCLYQIKKPAALFLLFWWVIGWLPVALSTQNWAGQTTILRGIIAWPAIFIISAIGLTALTRQALAILSRARIWSDKALLCQHRLLVPATLLWLLIVMGGITAGYHYFVTWKRDFNIFSDHPATIARYLNSQSSQLTLTPLKFYAENVGHFLLQKRYPHLKNITPNQVRRLLNNNPNAVYLLPHKSPFETAFVLLDPAQSTAYLLPPLTITQAKTLATTPPLTTVLDGEQEPVAHVYLLPANLDIWLNQTIPQTTMQADFDGSILLTGYTVESTLLKPGQTLVLTLYWQAQPPVDGDYVLFIHLYNLQNGQRYGQINTSLDGGLFDAHRWPADLIIPDVHTFTLPADAPEGVYRFEVGLYHAASQQRLPVLGPSPADKIELGKAQLRRQLPTPPRYPLEGVQFGDYISLIGFDCPAHPLPAGDALTFTLHWQAQAPPPENYTVFTHLLDARGNLRAQQDNAPQQGRYPTSLWDAGEIVLDSYTLPITNLESGNYTLRIGLYRPDTGQRLPLKNNSQDFVDLPVAITIVD